MHVEGQQTHDRTGQPVAPADAAIDHTRVIDAVMRNTLPIIKALRLHDVLAKKRPLLTAADVLAAAASVLAKDPAVHGPLKVARTDLAKFRQTNEKLPQAQQRLLVSITSQLKKAPDLAGVEAALVRLEKQHGGDTPGLAEGVKGAKRMLRDGKKTIYNPSSAYHEMVSGGNMTVALDSSKNIASSDGAGLVVGGILGSIGGWAGAAAAGSALAITASATAAVKGVIDGIIGTNDVPLFDGVADEYPHLVI